MKAKANKAKSAVKSPPASEAWRISDLPLHQQSELRKSIEEARRGEGLMDAAEAMEEAEHMAEEMIAVLNRPRRPRRASR